MKLKTPFSNQSAVEYALLLVLVGAITAVILLVLREEISQMAQNLNGILELLGSF
jgi:hypothetical protein